MKRSKEDSTECKKVEKQRKVIEIMVKEYIYMYTCIYVYTYIYTFSNRVVNKTSVCTNNYHFIHSLKADSFLIKIKADFILAEKKVCTTSTNYIFLFFEKLTLLKTHFAFSTEQSAAILQRQYPP